VRAYLDRAGPERERLGVLIDRYLELAPVQEPDEETLAELQARLERSTPLIAARNRRSLRVDQVVERLLPALGLAEPLRPKLKRRYQELEGEQLDPGGVDGRVWAALRDILGVDARRLVPKPIPKLASPAFYREADEATVTLSTTREAIADEPDEVDLLFCGAQLR